MRHKIQIISLVLSIALSPVVLAAANAGQGGTALTPLENQVRHALVILPYYNVFDNLEFQVVGTKAILSGQVIRPTLKRDAENAVKRIAGIDAVENNIEVLPWSSFDNQIRIQTYRAIYRNSSFTKYAIQPIPPIHIIVKNGDVTLVGVVSSQGDRNIANISARSVAGVFSVANELRVA